MGSKTSTQTTTVGKASPEEEAIRQLLSQVAASSSGQMGDLSSIAGGNFNLTPEQLSLINQTVGAQADQSRSALESQFAGQRADLTNYLAKKGQSDSSIEMVQQGLLAGQQARGYADIELQRAAQAGQYGMALPFQAAQTQIGANAQLLAQLGAATPALESYLRERLGSSTTTTREQGGVFGQFAALGQAIAGGGAFGKGGIFGGN